MAEPVWRAAMNAPGRQLVEKQLWHTPVAQQTGAVYADILALRLTVAVSAVCEAAVPDGHRQLVRLDGHIREGG